MYAILCEGKQSARETVKFKRRGPGTIKDFLGKFVPGLC